MAQMHQKGERMNQDLMKFTCAVHPAWPRTTEDDVKKPENEETPYTACIFRQQNFSETTMQIIYRPEKHGGGLVMTFATNGKEKCRMVFGEDVRERLFNALSKTCEPSNTPMFLEFPE